MKFLFFFSQTYILDTFMATKNGLFLKRKNEKRVESNHNEKWKQLICNNLVLQRSI